MFEMFENEIHISCFECIWSTKFLSIFISIPCTYQQRGSFTAAILVWMFYHNLVQQLVNTIFSLGSCLGGMPDSRLILFRIPTVARLDSGLINPILLTRFTKAYYTYVLIWEAVAEMTGKNEQSQEKKQNQRKGAFLRNSVSISDSLRQQKLSQSRSSITNF